MPGGSKKGGGLKVGSAYKMKNSALHMGAKHGSPIQGNYGSPNKDYSVGKGSHDHPHSGAKYASPVKNDGKNRKKEVRIGSTQETDTDTSGKTVYKKTGSDSLISGQMKNLKENEPAKDSKQHASWQKAYDKASSNFTSGS